MPTDNGCKVYVAVSGKGGAGKSTVACGLGIAMARAGHTTLLIDADEGLRCLDLMLGLAGEVVFDIGDLLNDRCTQADAVKPVPGVNRLFLLPAPIEHGTVGGNLAALVDKLRCDYDRIVIDATAGIGDGFKAAVHSADEVIAVVGCDPVSIRDARNVCELLEDIGVRSRRMIINRFDYKAVRKSILPRIDRMIDDTALRLVGIIPYDSMLTLGAIHGSPVLKGNAFRAFARIAARLDGKNIKLPKLRKI